jgi:hypothetical protein
MIDNAELLVNLLKSWSSRLEAGEVKALDSESMNEVVEVIFSSLHRWLSWKSLARLPKSHSSRSARSVPHTDETDWRCYLSGDPWDDCDELAAEDLMSWLVETMDFREENATREDIQGFDTLKSVKLAPRYSIETASTIAPSESMPATSGSIASGYRGSDCSSNCSYGRRPQKMVEDEDKKDILNCGLSRRLVPVLSHDDEGTTSQSRPRVQIPRTVAPQMDVAGQRMAKKNSPGLLNPIVDIDLDMPYAEFAPVSAYPSKGVPEDIAPASTWPKRKAKEKPAACYCISCLLGLEHHTSYT